MLAIFSFLLCLSKQFHLYPPPAHHYRHHLHHFHHHYHRQHHHNHHRHRLFRNQKLPGKIDNMKFSACLSTYVIVCYRSWTNNFLLCWIRRDRRCPCVTISVWNTTLEDKGLEIVMSVIFTTKILYKSTKCCLPTVNINNLLWSPLPVCNNFCLKHDSRR